MKKMSKGLLMTALICGTMNMTAYAQAAEPQEFVLDEYVVTAARTETKLVDTPANVTVVDAGRIEEGRYSDVSEVLKDVPGAVVMDDGTGATTKSVMLNGDDRVLIMVDGRRMNFDMGTFNGNSGFDMNMLPDVSLIERIEVVKGHGGSLYGSDAVGGVINIITKKADHDFGKVSVGFGSNQARDMKAMYSFKEDKTGVTVAASKYKQGYYKYKDAADDATKRWPGDSSFETEKISLKVSQELTADSNLEIGYDHGKMEGVSFSYIGNKPEYATTTDKTTDNFYAKYDWVLNDQDAGYFQVYHNDLDYKAFTKPNSHYKEKTVGIDVQQAITTSETNKLIIGSSWRKSNVDNKGIYDESIDNLAVFINDQWEFAPTWSLNAGARLDHHSEFGSETTMSAGINKKLDDNSHVYVNWGQVFRAPTTDDLYTYMKSEYDLDGRHYINTSYGNPNLKPEKGDNWTIGYGTIINEKTYVNVSYFQSNLEDAINWVNTYTQTESASRVENVDEQKKRGMELSVSHELSDQFDVEASYTYVRVKNNENGAGFVRDGNAIPNIYRLGLRYHDVKWNADLFLRAGSGADASKYVDSSYVTVDMSVNYKANDAVTIFAKGYNLFNEAYAEHGGATNGSYNYPAQARRFIAGVEYSF